MTEFSKYQISVFQTYVEQTPTTAIIVNLQPDKCLIQQIQTHPTIKLIKEQEITEILPEMSSGCVAKALKAVTKQPKFQGFSVAHSYYSEGLLTMHFSHQPAPADYVVELSLEPAINLVYFAQLRAQPVSMCQLGGDIYIAYADTLERFAYDKNAAVFSELGQDKIVEIAGFDNKLAILLFSNSLIVFDPRSQRIDKVKLQNSQLLSSNEFSIVGAAKSGNDLLVSVAVPEEAAIDHFKVSKYIFKTQHSNLRIIESNYWDGFLLVFFQAQENVFCVVIAQNSEKCEHQIVEMMDKYSEIQKITIQEVIRVQESDQNTYMKLQSAAIKPEIKQLFYCTECLRQRQTELRKVSQIGEIICEITDLDQISVRSFNHERYLLCKSLLVDEIPISELFELALNLFEEFNIVKPTEDVMPNVIEEKFVTNIYEYFEDGLSSVVLFACLRYQELLPFIEFIINRKEERIDVENNQMLFSYKNVRPLSSFLEFIVDSACELLQDVFNSYEAQTEDLKVKIDELMSLETVVESSMKIMEILLKTREFDASNAFSDVKAEGNYIIMSARSFICISNIIKYFSVTSGSNLLEISVPLTYEDAGNLGLEKEDYLAPELSESTYVNDEVDQIISGNESLLYTEQYGFYDISEDFKVENNPVELLPNYSELYEKLNLDGNTAIFSVISAICQIFNNGVYVKLQLKTVLEYLLHFRDEVLSLSNIYIEEFEAVIYSIVLIFGYIKMMEKQNQTEILQFIKDISPYTQNETEVSNELFLLCKIFSTIDSSGSESDKADDLIIKSYDNYKLYSELIAYGAGKELDDADTLFVNLKEALSELPVSFKQDGTLTDEEISEKTGELWALRLSELACSKKQFNLSRSLANAAPATPIIAEMTLWPDHPCQTGTELYLRASIIDYVVNKDIKALVKFLTELRVYLNSFALTEGDSITNRRIASIFCQIALNEMKWEQIYNIEEDLELDDKNVHDLRSSGYRCNFKKLAYTKIPSALILYQEISDVEKRILICYALQNYENPDFLLAFLYQNDIYLCEEYVEYEQQQNYSSKLLSFLEDKLESMPKFLYQQNLRKTSLLENGQFADPVSLLPSYFIEDLDHMINVLEKSLLESENLSVSEILKTEQEEDAPVVVNEEAGAINFINLMHENEPIFNVRCKIEAKYAQPQEQEIVYPRKAEASNYKPWEYGNQEYEYPTEELYNKEEVLDYPAINEEPIAPVENNANEPVVRETKATLLREEATAARLADEKKKEEKDKVKYNIIGEKETAIKLAEGQEYENNYEQQMAANYEEPMNNYQYPNQMDYNVNYEYPAGPNYEAEYEENQQEKETYQEAKATNPFSINKTTYHSAEPAYNEPYELPYEQNKKATFEGQEPIITSAPKKLSFNPSFEPSIEQEQEYEPPSVQSFNPSFEPTIQNVSKAFPRRAQFKANITEEPLMDTAEHFPDVEQKPQGILKHTNMENSPQRGTIKKPVAFDIKF